MALEVVEVVSGAGLVGAAKLGAGLAGAGSAIPAEVEFELAEVGPEVPGFS